MVLLSQRLSPRQGLELAGGGAGGTGRHQPHGEGQKQLSATLCLAALAVCQAVGPHCNWTTAILKIMYAITYLHSNTQLYGKECGSKHMEKNGDGDGVVLKWLNSVYKREKMSFYHGWPSLQSQACMSYMLGSLMGTEKSDGCRIDLP